MDILASDFSNSSNWSSSQRSKEEQDIVPFLDAYDAPSSNKNTVQAGFSLTPRSPSVSNQTAVMMTDGSAMTGSSSFGQGSSRQTNEVTCHSPKSADVSLTEQRVACAEAQLNPDGGRNSRQDDAASEFSRSTSSSWSPSENSGVATRSSKLHLSELIGRGAFGSVYRGSWKDKLAAIKASAAICLPHDQHSQLLTHALVISLASHKPPMLSLLQSPVLNCLADSAMYQTQSLLTLSLVLCHTAASHLKCDQNSPR